MIDEIYFKLTPSAKDALNELTEDYRNSLMEKAYTIAKERNTANREISLRDILEAQQPFEKIVEKPIYDYKRRKWGILLSFSGAIYAIAGLLLYLFQNKKFSIENDLGLVVAVIGILLTVIAFLYGQLLTKRRLNTVNSTIEIDSFEIVKRWQIIEQLTTSIMRDNGISSNSINQIIQYLTDNFAESESDYLKLRELLQMRNRILHENYNLSNNEKKHYIEIADSVIDQLERAKKQCRTANN